MISDSGPQRKFWQIALADLKRQLGAGPNGPSSTEAAARRLRYGPNTLEERRRLSLPLNFFSRFRNPLVIILLAAAVISALTGDLTSFIIISTIVLMSAVLDTVQEMGVLPPVAAGRHRTRALDASATAADWTIITRPTRGQRHIALAGRRNSTIPGVRWSPQSQP